MAAEADTRTWYVYLIRNEHRGVLYTGITLDLDQRVQQHNSGRGAKFTRGKGSWELVGFKVCTSVRAALLMEIAVKKLSVAKKLEWAGVPADRYKTTQRKV